MAEPQQVVLKNPQGDIVTVAPEDAHAALQSGFSTTTPEEYQQAIWTSQHETAGQEAKTGLEGFAQGLLPGAVTLEEKLGLAKPEDIKARAEINPGIHTVGAVAGGVAQAVGLTAATAGLGEAAGLGAEAARAGQLAEEASPALQAATDVAQGGKDAAEAAAAAGGSPGAVSAAADASALQGPLSVDQAKAVATAKSAMGYGEQAIAGAAQGGTGYVNESELGDHEFNGQAMAAQIGLGALLGVGGEAGINLLGEKVLPPVLAKASGVLDDAGAAVRNAWGKATEKVNNLTPGTFDKALTAVRGGAEKANAELATSMADNADTVVEQLGAVTRRMESDIRPAEAANNLKDTGAADVAPHLEKLNNQLQQTLGEITQSGVEGYKSTVSGIDEARSKIEAAITAPTSAEQHALVREARSDIGALTGKLRITADTTPDQAALIGKLKSTYGAVGDNLKSADVWGDASAARMGSLDKSIRNVINNGNQVAKDFGFKEIDQDSGKLDWSFKASKILNALKGDPLANQERIMHFQDWIDSAKAYVEDAKTSAGTAGAVVPGGDDLTDLLDHLTAQRAAGQSYAPIADLIRQTRQQPPLGVGAIGAGPLLGGLAHAAGLSLPGATAIGAGVALLRSPIKAMQAYAKIASVSAAAKQAIGSAVRKTFASAPARVAITGALGTSLRGRTFQSAAGSAAGSDFDKQAKHIGELAADHNEQMNRLAKNTSRVSDVAPNTAAAMHQSAISGLAILAQSLPKNPAPSLLASENKAWEPSEPQLQQWNDLHEAILKPSSYLDRIADGTADPDVWPKLQQAYPAWAEEVQSQTMQHLQTHPKLELDDAQKLSASMILGVPISPTVDPAQIAWQQGLFASASVATSAPTHGKRPSQHGMDKLALGSRSSLNQERKA